MTRPSSFAQAELLFSGRIGTDYDILKLICPMAAELSRQVGAFVAGLAAPPSGRLAALEIGCGTGITTRALLGGREDLEVTAVDNEPTMLDQAQGNLAELLGSGRLRLAAADALTALRDLPSASIDVVASAYTIHNFLDDYRTLVLAEIFRVLRPGGTFVNGDRYAHRPARALDSSSLQRRLTRAGHAARAGSGADARDRLLPPRNLVSRGLRHRAHSGQACGPRLTLGIVSQFENSTLRQERRLAPE